MSEQALIFANGEIEDGPMVRHTLEQAPAAVIIAADGGARVARHFQQTIDIVIGDMDSLSAAEVAELEAAGVRMSRFPEQKDETDLELAILWAIENGLRWIRILGAVGGRFDQTLSNVHLMALPVLRECQCDVRLVTGNQETWLIYPGETIITGEIGDTLSLIPVGGAAQGVRTAHLQYPLRDETLRFGPARGVSNVLTEKQAHVWFEEGILLIVHTSGSAE